VKKLTKGQECDVSLISHQYHREHTQTLGFCVVWGLSIDAMIFILYNLYILSPYTNPTHHRKLSAFLHF